MAATLFNMRLNLVVSQATATEMPNRIKQIDLVRGFSIWVVVLAHGFMGYVIWEPEISIGNLLSLFPNLQWLSWLLQVMPLFFMAGAAANSISYSSAQSKNSSYGEWVYRRISRLLAPVFWYLIAVILISSIIENQFEREALKLFLNLATQMIWFLGIYILMTAATPIWLKLSKHFVMTSLIGITLIAMVDFLRLESAGIGLLNFIFGWGLISVLGIRLLAEIKNQTISKSWLKIALGLFLSLELLLVFWIGYPISLVGLPNAEFSNMAPPSLLIVLHGFTQSIVWAYFSNTLERQANKPLIWRFTIRTNLSAMTIYLWHLPLIMFSHLALHLVSFENAIPETVSEMFRFYLQHFTFIAGCVGLVYLWAQYAYILENMIPPLPKPIRSDNRFFSVLGAFGATLTSISLLMFSVVGPLDFPSGSGNFADFSWTNGTTLALFSFGLLMIWGGAKARRPK